MYQRDDKLSLFIGERRNWNLFYPANLVMPLRGITEQVCIGYGAADQRSQQLKRYVPLWPDAVELLRRPQPLRIDGTSNAPFPPTQQCLIRDHLVPIPMKLIRCVPHDGGVCIEVLVLSGHEEFHVISDVLHARHK